MRTGAVLVLAIGVLSALGAPEVHASKRAAIKEWLLFDSARTGRTEVYALPAAGKAGLRQLTFMGGSNPRPAPNGRFILFDRSSGTWIMRADGRGAKLLLRGAVQASWAPDSRRIVYAAETGGIGVADRDGSRKHVLTRDTDDRYPQWSPNGRAIAFLRAENLLVSRGGRRTVLATDATGAFAWSPNGSRIAFRSGMTLALVNANGTGRTTLIDPWYVDDTPDGPAWSPDGRQIAYTDVVVQIVDVASRRVRALDPCSLLAPSSTEPVWDRSGDEIAFVDDHDEICTAADGGPPSILHVDARRPSRPFFLAWTKPPRGTHYRKAAPSNDTAIVASASELKAKAPIEDIAADGSRVAFHACHELGVWTPDGHSFVEVTRERPLCDSYYQLERLWDVTLAGNLFGYGDEIGLAAGRAWVELSVLGSPTRAEILGPGTGGIGSTGIGFLLGHGPMLVFSTWGDYYACNGPDSPCPSPHGQPLWRVPLPLANGECTPVAAYADPSPPCVKLAAGPVEPLAVDDTRVVVRKLDGTIEVLDGSGKVLVSLPLNAPQGTAAAIAGSDLVVLVAGALRDYDASTGALLHEWPMPRVTTFGFCGTYFCGRGELELEDAARGLAVYILDGNLHLLRLRDGADVVVGPATAAQLEDAGLFYAYRGAYPYPGRIRFVPFDKLPLG